MTMSRIDRDIEKELQHIWTKLDKLEKKFDASLEMFKETLVVFGVWNNLIGDEESPEMRLDKETMEEELGIRSPNLGS